MRNIVIGIDCPGCGTIKDIRVPYDASVPLTLSTDRDNKITRVSYPAIRYINVKRIVYVYIENNEK